MNVQVQPHVTTTQRHLPFECVALVLQGSGALGAYQAGVYEALAEAGIQPDWVAGVSVGAINAAIIAGNPLNSRIDRLREFWTKVTSDGPLACFDPARFGLTRGDSARNLFNHLSASLALANGAKGFFAARPVIPWLQPAGTIEATSFYDTRYLKRTLERLVDFDRLKATLTNCVRLGPESQNRAAHPNFMKHLEGRIGFVEMANPEKARRLRKLWEQIVWR